MEVGPRIIFKIGEGQLHGDGDLRWIISIIILIFAFLATRNMQRIPKGAQLLGEMLVGFVYKMVKDVMGEIRREVRSLHGHPDRVPGLRQYAGSSGSQTDHSGSELHGPAGAGLLYHDPLQFHPRQRLHRLQQTHGVAVPLDVAPEPHERVHVPGHTGLPNLRQHLRRRHRHDAGLQRSGDSISRAGHRVVPFFQIAFPLPLNFWFDMFEPILQAYIFTMLTMVFLDNGREPLDEDSNH